MSDTLHRGEIWSLFETIADILGRYEIDKDGLTQSFTDYFRTYNVNDFKFSRDVYKQLCQIINRISLNKSAYNEFQSVLPHHRDLLSQFMIGAHITDRTYYTIRVPTQENPSWRSKPLDAGGYTGDVVEELWNGVMIRRHTYSVVQRRIEPPTGAHAYADLAGTTQKQFYRTEFEITTENLVDTYTKELPIPDEIKNGRWMAASGNLYQVKATWNKYALVLIDRRYVYGPWVDPQTQLLLNAEKKKISDIKQHLDDTIQVLYKIEGKRVELDENGALERRDEVLQGYDSMRETIYQEVMQAVRALQQNIRPDGPQTRELLTELHATISD